MTYHDKDVGLQALREMKNEQAKQIRNLLDQNTAPEDFAKVRDEVQKRTAEAEAIDERIVSWEKLLRIEAGSDTQAARDHADRTGKSLDESNHELSAARRAFSNALRFGSAGLTDEERAIVDANHSANKKAMEGQPIKNIAIGSPSTGGYLVPTIVMPQLLSKLKAFGGMRDFARILTTDNGDPISWGTNDDTAAEGELLAEATAAADDDISFGVVTINAYIQSSKTIAISLQALQDMAVDVEAEVLTKLAMRIARGQNHYATTGTGSSQPQGVVTAAGAGVTAASATAIAYAELVSLYHSIDPAYRSDPSCKWMFNDAVLKAFKSLVDGNGRPLWLPGLASAIDTPAAPDTLLGKPYVVNQHMPAMTTGQKPVLFGRGDSFMIRDVMSTLILRFTDSAYAKKLQVGFLAFARYDSRLIDFDNSAIKVITMA